MRKRLDNIFKNARRIEIDDDTKLVIMSDCHRGAGNSYDNFIKNKNIYTAALLHYYHKGFTYVELGDGDDMWEVKNYNDIIEEHLDTFKILARFHNSNRLIMVYGNHDMCKKSEKVLKKYFYKHYNKATKQEEDLLNDLTVYESLVLNYKNYDIFMIHGHQIDLLNSTFWKLSRFLVRNIWSNLERMGIKDPTSAAKNYQVAKKTEKKLKTWSIKNNKILITGHTHRPIFPKIGESLYFNDGSCIHPNGVTCIEIEKGKITLAKWLFKLRDDNSLTVGREVIEGGEKIIKFFK